ncbi:MAG: hypothetical protein A2X08_09290 [Bacteroidetes bacterium GWA2_32_17]|nr:MAG: hypothetical protein A2X08_09290 [Bacteroidetes bacterium GWA2_32_17]
MKSKYNSLLFITIILISCSPSYIQYHNSGYRKVQEKDYKGAIVDFNLSIEKNSKYWSSYNNRGACYIMLDSVKKAIEDFDKAIILNSDNSMAYDNRGMCKEALGDNIGAIEDYYLALENNGRFNISYTHLALLFANMDSCKKSLYYLDIAIKRKAYDHCNTLEELILLKEKLEKQCKE